MTAFHKIAASGDFWFVSGAASLLEGIATAGDSAYAICPDGEQSGFLTLKVDVEPLDSLPTAVSVTGRIGALTGSPELYAMVLFDGDLHELFRKTPFVPASLGDFAYDLVQIYSGPLNIVEPWQLWLQFLSSPGESVSVDLLEGSYASTGSGGTGPGGARGPNAPILIPLMVQP